MSVMEAVAPSLDSRSGEDDSLYEVIDGVKVEKPLMSFHSSKIATRMAWKLGPLVDASNLGTIACETLFHMPLAEDRGRNRRPDLAFVSYERWPRDRAESIRENAWDVVPDLAIEVVSPNDKALELMEKISEYFEAGVRQVWVVYPGRDVIHIHDPVYSVRAVGRDEVLDGGAILPGVRLTLSEIFVFARIEEIQESDD
jgi:Uma2 family endonuclease